MTVQTLVVGGTGPTGRSSSNGLRERGHDVTIFHRGTHEIPEIPDDVEHIHGDPHFLETIDEAIAGHTFDQVVATYGRIRLTSPSLLPDKHRALRLGRRRGPLPRLLQPPAVAARA